MDVAHGVQIPARKLASLMGLLYVMLGVEVLLGVLLARSIPWPASFGVLLPVAIAPNFVGAQLIRRHYEHAYGLRIPRANISPVRMALATIAGVLLAGSLLFITVFWVLAEPPVSFFGAMAALFTLVFWWAKRGIADYWLLLALALLALSFLPAVGIGGETTPGSPFLSVDTIIFVVLGIGLIIGGLLDHQRLLRLLRGWPIG